MGALRFISKGSHSLSSLVDDCKSIKQLKQIHAQIITSANLPDPTVLISRLLFVCATTAAAATSLSYVTAIFQQIHNPNLFIYNCIIRAHSHDGRTSVKCLSLYKRMLLSGISPDHLTFSFLLKACVRLVDLLTGQGVHGHVLKLGFHNDVYVQNVVISMYTECKVLDSGRRVFDEMIEKDVVSWNTVIIGFLRCGALDSALALFRMMNGKNLITWNSIITGFVQGGRPKEALALFQEMQITSGDGVLPDGITLASVLSACAMLGALDHGKWVHRYLKRRGLEFDVVIGTALVDMYGKCGCVDQSVEVFNEMPKKDVLAWTSMIKVLADHGLAREAIELFKEMERHGTKPNPVTFVPVLCACAHAGLVRQGWRFFQLMTNVYSIAPQVEHYACMVDLLSRTGLFSAAEELIRGMEVEPDVYVWGALLGGCRMHGNVELGEQVAHHLINLEPQNHAFYIALSDIYAKAYRFDDVKRIRALMMKRGIKKIFPGCSMIEIDGIVREFSVQGSSEVVMSEIESVLVAVSFELKSLGFLTDSEDKLLEKG